MLCKDMISEDMCFQPDSLKSRHIDCAEDLKESGFHGLHQYPTADGTRVGVHYNLKLHFH